jgi:PAS domain S-box-containing protein
MHTPLAQQPEDVRHQSLAEVVVAKRAWSLRTHLLVFGIALILPLLTLAGFLLVKINSSSRVEVEQRMAQEAVSLAAEIDREIQRRITVLQTLGTSPALARSDHATFHAYASAVLHEDKAGIFLIDPKSLQQLLNTYVAFGTELPTYGSPETAQRVLETKRWQVSNLFIGRISRRPALDIALPILRNGGIQYILIMGLEPFMFGEIVRGQKFPSDRVINIADRDGTIIVRSTDQDKYAGTRLPADLIAQQPGTVTRVASLEGTPVLRATATSRLSGWQIATNLPAAAADRPLRQGLIYLGMWSAVALFLTALIASWFARRMARPIAVAADAAADLAHRRAIPPLNSHIREANKLIGAIKRAAQDISDADQIRRAAEEQQRSAYQRLEEEKTQTAALLRQRDAIFSAMPNGVLVIDYNGRIQLLNERLAREFGYLQDELRGQSVEMLVPERFRGHHAALRQTFATAPSLRPMGAGRDLFGLRKDGTEFPIEIGLSPFTVDGREMVLAIVINITDRKQAEERQSQLAAIVDSSRDAIVSKSLDGTVITWNPGAEALLGYSASEMVGQSIRRIIPVERSAEEEAILNRLKAGQSVKHFETERITKQGARIPASVTISPIKDRSGRIIAASKVLRDITDRKHAEQALAERARQQVALYWLVDRLHRAETLTAMYDAALDTIRHALRCERASLLFYDDAGVMRFVAWRGLSDAYRKAVEGHSPWRRDDIDPQPVCVEDVDVGDLPESLKAKIRAENIQALTFIPIVANGHLIGKFMTYYENRHGFSADEIDLALAIARQVGGGVVKKRGDEALRESERRLELALTAGQMGAWEWNIRTNRVFWSPGLERLHGLEPGTFGGTFDDFKRDIHPGDTARVLHEIQGAVEECRDHHILYRVNCPDGSVRWLEAVGRLTLGSDGGPESMAGVCIDVTERKRAEETEKLLSAELQHRMKNLFAVIQALAMRTLRGELSLDEAREAFVGRLQALARSDIRLGNSAWSGTSLGDVVKSELRHFADQNRSTIDGPEIMLSPQAAQNLALAIHELATNAAKYGSLSTPGGTVVVGWTVANNGEGEALHFHWQEGGGPPVVAPKRKGFGTSLLETTLGKGHLEYGGEGLRYEIELDLAEIGPGGTNRDR